jgi:hypothetical protein
MLNGLVTLVGNYVGKAGNRWDRLLCGLALRKLAGFQFSIERVRLNATARLLRAGAQQVARAGDGYRFAISSLLRL